MNGKVVIKYACAVYTTNFHHIPDVYDRKPKQLAYIPKQAHMIEIVKFNKHKLCI